MRRFGQKFHKLQLINGGGIVCFYILLDSVELVFGWKINTRKGKFPNTAFWADITTILMLVLN